MNRSRVIWGDGFEGLPTCDWMLEAVPGVGNVGKLVVDSLVDTHGGILVARILHPDLPPHSTLGVDGLLAPPSLEIHLVTLPDDSQVLTAGSNFQPLTPAGQFEVASTIIQLCRHAEIGRLLILAGLSAEPGNEGIHYVCASPDDVAEMTKLSLEVSAKHPSAGIIGLTGLIASLAPTYYQPSVCVIAETVGTSVDVVAADRLSKSISESFSLKLGLEIDNTESTAERLREFFDLEEIAELDFGTGGKESDSQAFYA